MSAYPVTMIVRPVPGSDEALKILCGMVEHSEIDSALAATPLEPGDRVEFAWWAVPNYHDNRIPQGSG